MAIAVNLLKNRRTLSEKEYQREQQFLRIAVLSLVIVMFITIALSIWNYLLSSRLTSIEAAITKSSKEMQNLTDANAQQVYLKSRLKLITAFLDDRTVSRESIQRVFSLNIPGATITSTTFLTDNVIAIQVSSNSVAVLNKVIAYYQSDSSYFMQVVSRGISRGKDGSYDLQLELTVPSNNVKAKK